MYAHLAAVLFQRWLYSEVTRSCLWHYAWPHGRSDMGCLILGYNVYLIHLHQPCKYLTLKITWQSDAILSRKPCVAMYMAAKDAFLHWRAAVILSALITDCLPFQTARKREKLVNYPECMNLKTYRHGRATEPAAFDHSTFAVASDWRYGLRFLCLAELILADSLDNHLRS